jgi:hypothetical protein
LANGKLQVENDKMERIKGKPFPQLASLFQVAMSFVTALLLLQSSPDSEGPAS